MPCMERFTPSMEKCGIDKAVIDRINDGFPELNSKVPKAKRGEYFARAVRILDECADPAAFRDIMDENGCCKSGARLKASKEFAKENAGLSIEERCRLIPDVPNMGKPRIDENGRLEILAVQFYYGDRFHCACPNFNNTEYDGKVSRSYCMCCAGHFRFHYQKMLGVKLRLYKVLSSPLDTEGKEPCAFLFDILE